MRVARRALLTHKGGMRLAPLDFLTPADLPVPQDRPFSTAEALDGLHDWRRLGAAVERGLLVQPLRGCYQLATLPDTLQTRVASVRLVVPPDAVVCDRTAGWLHGAPMILAPGDHVVTPRVSVFVPVRGRRMRNGLMESGSRDLEARDIVELDGLRVTSPLRTSCDLGRRLHRAQALAALDSMLRSGSVTRDEILDAVERFRGFRGVRRLRELAPIADGRAESPPESALRLTWLDCAELPRPDLQIEIPTPWGTCFRLDLGVPELAYAGEYDGPEWHGEERLVEDRERRAWIEAEAGWTIDAFVAANVYGPTADADTRLRHGVRRALAARRSAWYCV